MIIKGIIGIFFHLDKHLDLVIRTFGDLSYLLFFLIVFAETRALSNRSVYANSALSPLCRTEKRISSTRASASALRRPAAALIVLSNRPPVGLESRMIGIFLDIYDLIFHVTHGFPVPFKRDGKKQVTHK